MRRERWLRATILCAAVGSMIGGCGSGGGSVEAASTANTGPAKSATAGAAPRLTNPHGVRDARQRAGQGLTPSEPAHRFAGEAQKTRASRVFIAEVIHPAPAVEKSAGYPRLVAALYALTQPGRGRKEAAAGCA